MIKTVSVDLERFKGALGFSATYSCKWGNTRKAAKERVTLDTNEADPQLAAAQEKKAKARMKLSKELIKSPEYDAIKKFYSAVNKQIEAVTVPSFFRDGFRLATVEAVDQIEAIMTKATTVQLPALVKKLQAVFPGQVDEARTVLEPVGQWNPSEYPQVEALPGLFSIGWNWISFSVPEGLPPALRQKEQDKMERQFAEAGQQITEALRMAFGELIAHATERLTVQPGEKQKVFRDSILGNVQAFIDTFAARNLMGDAELAVLVNQAKAILLGVTPQKLRDYASVRTNTLTQFSAIQTTLDGMLGERAARKITLDDEPEADAVAA